jgi:cellulose synthase/poly-beta-1,6-N-acetylglucosamine synthase-like glycosyltransferase
LTGKKLFLRLNNNFLMVLVLITLVLFIGYAGLLIYYTKSWFEIPIYKHEEHKIIRDRPFISVIIPARNEEQNIVDCVISVLNQDYPRNLFEIIVADDFSTDRTVELVQGLAQDNVHVVMLNQYVSVPLNSYKKKAIEVSIGKSSGELILTTDADCIVPSTWLSTIAAFYKQHNAAFIAAPVVFHNERSFLDIFQSLDFITLQGITGASVYKRFHIMCNGANLAYERSAFYEVNGFSGIDQIASGDDMLLMHKIKALYPDRVLYLKSPDAIVKTATMPSVNSFLNQRIRWASKSGKYQEKMLVGVLLIVYLFNVAFLALAVAAIFNITYLYWLVVFFVAKTIFELIYLTPVARFFGKTKLLWWFPIAQPFHILYTILAGWLGTFGSYKWKGRKVK